MQYVMVDQVARSVAQCGHGALMAKTDLCSAYRQVPVHTSDQYLLGLEWGGTTYIDRALPFGLHSAPKLFSAVADGLAWALHCESIVNCVHYLDDFFFWGAQHHQHALQRWIPQLGCAQHSAFLLPWKKPPRQLQ